jgi:hypothetical protein
VKAMSRRTGLPLRPLRLLVVALAAIVVGALVALGSAQAQQAAQAPTNTEAPAVTGTPQVGQTLTSSTGTWTGDAPITFAFQWLRCDANGNNCNPIAGATNPTYTVVQADVGNTIRSHVTATNAAGSATAQSAAVAPTSPNAPANTVAPTITGTPQEGQTVTANPGTWTGTAPIAFTYQWHRCNPAGEACAPIPGATSQNYAVTTADVGHTLRVAVTGTNAQGSASVASAQTAVVATSGPAGQVRLPGGGVSIPVTSVSLPARLVVSGVQFSPNPVRSRNQPIQARFRVTDTRGFVVRDAIVFVRSTPLVTSTPAERPTGQDGWVTFEMMPQAGFPLGGTAVQFFVRARKQGEPLLAGVSTRRLVQVRTG